MTAAIWFTSQCQSGKKDYEFMKHHFPNYEMVTLEESGHWIHVDDPEGFNKATEEFFCNK